MIQWPRDRLPDRRRGALGQVGLPGLLLALLAQMALVLTREPCVGVADNRDYWRVAPPAGIDAPRLRTRGYYVVCSYATAEPDLPSFFSSPALVAWAARPLAWGLAVPEGRFDLRQLGRLYWLASAALLAGALALGLPPLLALLFAWVLADPGFLLFFNSLYADPALLVGLLGVICLLPFADRGRALPPLLLAAALAGFEQDAVLALSGRAARGLRCRPRPEAGAAGPRRARLPRPLGARRRGRAVPLLPGLRAALP